MPTPFGPNWKEVSPQAKEVVAKMLEKDPDKRISLEDFMMSEWLTGEEEQLKSKRKDSAGVEKFLAFTQSSH